ncbi:hypothetical protein VOLCADRAFT_63971 [Volvox carteri f. nagariensis]|uniref:xanthine dehydrogenase n=1 Tax=Volvox carteri f. nagariensis TaxID=3068 RepID=D8U4V3_VOLCA|nr:uncharacterized protein VOLCADRAFT_63971 [Volvox carteri f. nagariensis]EFJ45339.1 hypothetical protein VOLCADRAFT_63971 [Volvox carteri f. nagariensis]|eukprot:XP_002953715.1 hypothetical protein VOLCADRAFT_63971 [Volvox carteri f. nagariensis]
MLRVESPSAPEPVCYINGKRYALPADRGEATLLQFLRENGLTGTKLGCGEGGCGACTVMLSHYEDGRVVHRSANACLCPLYAVEGMQVVTVEGLGNVRDGLHPVQQRLAVMHGSQCGFCTPGFVMSMYSLLRSCEEAPTEEDIEDALGGNLCRCTGYRPILDAFKTFAKTDPAAYTEEAIAASKGLIPGVCPSSGMPCDCASKAGGGCGSGSTEKAAAGGIAAAVAAAPARPTCEPIFPPELKKRPAFHLAMPGPVVTWHRPATLEQLLELKSVHPDAKLVVGNTEVGIEMKFKNAKYPVIIAPTHVKEMNQITVTETGVEIGAAVTLTRMMKAFKGLIASRPRHEVSAMEAVVNQLRWFAGNQIRNVSALGGNIVTGSPISDLNPLWMAAGATFVALGKDTGERAVRASEFFLGYRFVDLRPHEVLYKVVLPFTRHNEYVKEFKQSPRREDDIAIVNAGMRVKLARGDSEGVWVVEEAAVAFGGVAPRAIMAPSVAAALVGKPWDQETLQAALAAVRQDVVLVENAPGGKVEYRRALAASFVFKFFVHAAITLEVRSSGKEGEKAREGGEPLNLSPLCAAAIGCRYRNLLPQAPATPETVSVVGQPHHHMAAELQVSGEAQYTDDIKMTQDTLVAALVTSTKPHAKITKLDASAALQVPGVVGFYSAKDVPGSNAIGPVWYDEEVFATSEVTAVGQVIGVVVATSEAAARAGARVVEVGYEDLPAVMSIEEAIEAGAFYEDYTGKLECGDVDSAWAQCDHVGGQEHFYLEPNNCVVIPHENDEFTLFSSTQAPAKHQKYVALVLGVPAHKIVSKTKRLGGGFGGKETRGIFIHCAAAVPSYHLKRPVRLCLDRDEDMQMTGQRHAFLATYKVGFTADGRVLAAELDLYNNAGNSHDLSHSIMDRALLHSDCVYKVPNMRVRGHMCRTNQASNTAFRGFGGPQGLMFAEMWIEQIAKTLGKPDVEVRTLNMYKEGDVTHFGQVLEHCRARACWETVLGSSSFTERRDKVAEFNSENRWRKRGIAATPTKFGISFTTKFLNQAGALVHIYLDGTVLVTHGGVEMGQGLHTKMAQVAAQALNVPLSKVFISETSTDKVPNASPTAASASSDMYGAAVLDACRQLSERLAPYRSKLPSGTWKEVVNAAYLDRVDLSAHGFYATPDITGFGGNRPFNYFCFGAAVSEVELDVLTGDMQVLRSDLVMDVGNPINPAIDIGQVEGGFVQGMGWLVLEELMWGDKQHPWVRPGHLFTKGPGTYKIPSVNDIPVDFRVQLLANAPNVRAIHSSKAVGEPPFHLGASVFFALKEAVYAAREAAGIKGFFVLDAPATPERLRLLCSDEVVQPYAHPDIRCAALADGLWLIVLGQEHCNITATCRAGSFPSHGESSSRRNGMPRVCAVANEGLS